MFSVTPSTVLGLCGYEDQHKRRVKAEKQNHLYRNNRIFQFCLLILKFQQKAQATHLNTAKTKLSSEKNGQPSTQIWRFHESIRKYNGTNFLYAWIFPLSLYWSMLHHYRTRKLARNQTITYSAALPIRNNSSCLHVTKWQQRIGMEKESLEKQSTSILFMYLKCLIDCGLQNVKGFFSL